MAVQSPKKSSALPWPALVPLGHHAGKSAISLKKTVILVGSRHNAHLHLLSRHVSKAHALILSDGGRSYIRDLASREQIYVNGVAEREAWLKEGDLLKIGSFTFKFKEGPGAADAQEVTSESAVLAIEGSETPLAIAEKVMLIGRRATCDVSLIEASVSTAHAVMFHVGGKRFLRDLGSRTGTWVNGAKIHQAELNPGDSIKIGETEMRYDLASAYETALAPVEEEKNDLDELEDLVGTARIDMVSEMKKAEPLSPDLEADLRSMFGAGADAKPAKDDDLIELEIAHEPKPVPAAKAPPQPAAKEAPRPQPKAAPVEEPIELEPEADLPLEVAASESEKPQADWDEIDLSTDPDVTEIPSAADTRAIGMEFDQEPAKPTLSPKIVDGPIETSEPAEVLLGHDLHGIADIPPAETVEEPLEPTWPADILPTEEAEGQTATEDISPRGWQKSSRDEQLPVVDEGPLELEESAEDKAAQERAAAERAAEEKAAAERAAAEKAAQERAAEEKAAQERAAAEKAAQERAAAEKAAAEAKAAQERAAAEKAAQERATAEKAAAEKAAQERAAAEKAAQERAAAEKAAQEKAAAERAAQEKAAQERAAAEKAAAEKVAAEERAAQERAAAEKAAQERAAAEKAEQERIATEKAAEEEKAAQQRAAEERAAAEEKAAQERAAAEKAAAEEKAEQERIAAEEKAAEERAAAEQAVAEEKAAQERAAAERAAEEQAEKERLAEEKAAQKRAAAAERKAAQERAAAERAAAKAATPKKRGRKSKKEKEAELKAAAQAAAAAAMGTEADVIMTPAEPVAEIPAESFAEIPDAPVEEIAAPTETRPAEQFVSESVATPEEEVAPVTPSDAEAIPTEIAGLPAEPAIAAEISADVEPETTSEETTTSEIQSTTSELEISSPAMPAEAETAPEIKAAEFEALREDLDISPAAIPTEPELEVAATEVDVSSSGIDELPPELDISPASMPQEEHEVESAPAAELETTPTEVENLPPELDISPAAMLEPEPAAESDSTSTPVESDSSSNFADEDLPEIEEVIEEQPELQLVTDPDPLDEQPPTDNLEGLDEVLVLDEEPSPLPQPAGSSASAPADISGSTVAPAEFAPAASEDDFFSAFDDTMPVLELDAAELAPGASHRDPDVLLALDQVDPDALEEIEVIESTEPTLDSALDLHAVADQEVVSPQTGEPSLTDSVFGKQIEDFSHDSTGEIVEDEFEELPEIEEFHDADEELADALNSAEEPEAAAPIAETDEPLEEAHEAAQPEETNHNITAGGIDVLAPENLTDESLNTQHFGATGDAVHLDTPGDSQAEAVLNGQTFEADATGQSVATPTEELQSQSFTSEGDTHIAPPRPDLAGGPPETTTHTRSVGPSSGASYPAPPPPQRMPGLAGGFVMGADLSSFIGGMPLVLPDLAPPPTGFGRAQVSFAGAKAPWEQAQRPSFPVGQSLAQEMMDAAEGLRDAEAMDDDLPQEEVEEESIIDDGAPGDEWNVAGIMEDDYEAPVESFTPAALTAQFHAPAPAAETSVTETPEEEELSLDDLPLEELNEPEVTEELPAPETAEELPQAEISEEDLLSELEELPAEETLEELPETEALEELPTETLQEELAETDLSTEELTSEDAPAEVQPQASTDHIEDDLQGLEEIPAEEIPASAETEESLADLPELESIDELEATEAQETPAEIQSLESDPLETEWAEPQAEQTDTQAIEADLPVLPEADSSSTFSEDELLLELDAAPPATLPDEPPTISTTTNEAVVEDLSTEKLTFDEEAIEPLPAPPRIGAIEEAVADLQIEQVPEAESLVDRSPPPPVTPIKAKGQQQSKMVMPPPPARTLRPRRGAAAPAAELTPADPVFGSLEHGTTNTPPFGGIGQVREVDVFSQAASLDDNSRAMGAADASVFGGQMRSDPSNGNGDSHPPAVARRPQRVIVPPRMGVLGAGAAVADAEAEAGEPLTRPAYRVVPRRSSGKRVLLVIFIMAICMAAAYFAIIYYIHPRQTSTGELKFEGTTSLTKRDRDLLRKEQFAKLTSPQVLLNARTSLMTTAIPIEPGFLKDPVAVAQNLKPQWPDNSPVMTVEYLGSDPNDKSRVYALLSAMYLENAAVVDRSRRVASDIDKLEKDLKDIAELRARFNSRKAIVDAAPTEDAVQKLKDKVAEADSAYGKAVAALTDAKLEVQHAEEKLSPASANKPVAPGDPKNNASDAELAALQKSLTDSAAQIISLKAAASQDADAKRKALDDAIELFQQSAAGLMKDNPQLAQYVQAVQQLQESTHRLGGNLIQVQEQHHALLSKLKTRLDEQMQARRTEIWAADKELIGLRAQLDLAERGYNAARDALPPESKEIKDALADIQNLKGRIEARKMTLGNDPMFTAVANDIQEMIKVNQASLAADREHIEKDIKEQEQAFAQRNIVEKLPDTQRTQAAALKASQEHVSELRKQYAAALEARTAESNAAIRDLEAKVSDLNAKVDERKRVLASNAGKGLTPAEEARLRVIVEQKQAAMKTAGEEADTTLKLLVERTKALKLATDNRTELASAREELETLKQGLAGAKDREDQDKLSLDSKRAEQRNLVTIQKPTEENVKVVEAGDDRWRFIAYSETGLAVLFVGILAMVSLSAHKHPAYEHLDDEEALFPEAETGPLAIQEIGKRQPRPNAKSAVG